MTDIVWLLRNDVPCNGDIDCAGELCNQAAEEIERLRKDLSLAVFADNEYWQVLEKENERLRAALEVTSSDCKEAFAENERLRAALEVAANDLEDWGAYTKALKIRAALDGK